MMLKMPPQTSMTATVFMHRFLMRYSLLGSDPDPEKARDLMHPKVIAAVALFVAFKVDETMRRMKDFVVACCRVAMKKPDMVVDEQSKDYWRWRDLILQNESIMLEYLCFDLQLESPYRILWDYSQFLNVGDNRPLRHAAYAFLNDSTYTVLCLQFPPRVISAAALYAAARHCQVAFPDDSQGRPWWDQIDVKLEDLIRACKLIVKIYERVQMNLSKGYPDFSVSDTDPNDPTRIFHSDPTTYKPAESATTPSLNTPGSDSGVPNGRKRSREPEPHALENNHPTPSSQPPSTLNGGRSPKRQRTLSPSVAAPATQSPAPRPRIPLRAMEKLKPEASASQNRPPAPASLPKEDASAEEGEASNDKGPGASATDPANPPKESNDEGGGSEEGEI
jgi:protein BUR2